LDKGRTFFATGSLHSDSIEKEAVTCIPAAFLSIPQQSEDSKNPSCRSRRNTDRSYYEQTQKTYPAVTGRGRKTTVSAADPAEACSLSGQTEKQKGQAEQAHSAALTAAVHPYNRTLF
jgi:hypothetical protein